MKLGVNILLMIHLVLLAGTAAAESASSEPQTRPGRVGEPVKPQPRPNPKEPWEWTLDERLALRFDPVDMRRRMAEHAAENYPPPELMPADIPPPSTDGCIVNGSKDPALLLPSELFSSLLGVGFQPDDFIREPRRKAILEKAQALGFGDDLWPVLEVLAKDVLRVKRDAREKSERFEKTGERPPEATYEEQSAHCAQRARALQAVRTYYGAERFDRFLYEAVAPGMSIAMPENPEWPGQLRFVEGGCQ